MRLKKVAISFCIRVILIVAIFLSMLLATQSILATYSGTYGYPSSGAGILLSLFIVIIGIGAICFVALYKTRFIEKNERLD
jgi:nitric oxide reductase large subunit